MVKSLTDGPDRRDRNGIRLLDEQRRVALQLEVWPAKVKNYLFNKARAGTIDLHYRDYEERPATAASF